MDIGDDVFRDGMAQAGFPAPLVEMRSEYCAAVRAGTVDVVTDDVARLLRRPARDYRTWAAANAAAFAALTANPSR
ncbi:MAG TPA: hypothetical protein VH969_22395 [Actinophytocola sp.]|uniref:hypothetical protein n=1 Tax=Actinophytocola sp. TaxID=1872138 RepID=UPI002F939880